MLYRHNASDPIIMERPSTAAYAGPSFQKAIASAASATDGAAPNNPAKLLGRKTSASRAKVETANPPMKKRMTYSVTPRPPRARAANPLDLRKSAHSPVIVSQPSVGSTAQGHSAPLSIQARISFTQCLLGERLTLVHALTIASPKRPNVG